jgi:hypothetical protein
MRRLTRLRFLLVLEGQLDLRAVDELATVTGMSFLLDNLDDPEVPDRLAAASLPSERVKW